jgi:putative FmdB family regulatory protein
MPIYQYRCAVCGHEQEVLQKVSEPPLTECPSCGKPGMQKLLTAAGFQLKGSGWYATDFKGGAKKEKAEDKKPADSKTETKKTEPKSEAAL